MKRLLITVGVVLLIGAVAVPVMAKGQKWGRGQQMMGYGGGGPGSCWSYGSGASELTKEQQAQLEKLHQKFYDETAQLRTQLLTKSGELNILLSTSNPDVEKARALQKEISDLRAKMAQERLNLQLEARKISPDTRIGMGYGRGYGRHMRGYGYGKGGYGHHMGGYGPGSCWR